MKRIVWKIRPPHFNPQEPDGAPAYGNPCEVRKCLELAQVFHSGREVCAGHRYSLLRGHLVEEANR